MPRAARLLGPIVLAAASAACAAAPPPPAAPTQEIAIAAPHPPAAAEEEPARAEPAARAKPPKGYVEMTVVAVAPTHGGAALLLGDEARSLVIPIYVGGTEAHSIDLRLTERRPERPLTHDLLDAVLRELGADLVKVHVDELHDNVFIGSIYLRRGDKLIEIDARPSDAIALAVGSRAPIFVAQRVVDQAGVERPEDAIDVPGPRGLP